MRKLGDRIIHRLIQQNLARRIVDVVVAADNVGHLHQHVVDHHGQIVGRCPVASEQNQVVQFLVVETKRSAADVVELRDAGLRGLEADAKR